MTDYSILAEQLREISGSAKNPITVYANASALLYDSMPDLNWCGFYFADGDCLVLGPFQGKVACTYIQKDKGVCGHAFGKNETTVVPNVHEFPGHIACDCASNSEIVIPVRIGGTPVAVLDIDSPLFSRFSEDDRKGLETFTEALQEAISAFKPDIR